MICGTWIGKDLDESGHHVIEVLARLMHGVTEKKDVGRDGQRLSQGSNWDTQIQVYSVTFTPSIDKLLGYWNDEIVAYFNTRLVSLLVVAKNRIELAGKTIQTTCVSNSRLHFYRCIILLDLFHINRTVLCTVRDEAVWIRRRAQKHIGAAWTSTVCEKRSRQSSQPHLG